MVFGLLAVVGAGEGRGPENDQQRCERASPDSDAISFGDCKDRFPGQPGISGWD